MSLTELNYARDQRNRPGESPVLYVEQEDGSTLEVQLPTKWEVCSVCDGAGKHVNPSIDCDGLTAEDFADDPDFAEDYRRGTYDVTCYRCSGRTTERVIDWDRLTAEQKRLLEQQQRDEAYDYAERISELRYGY